MSKLIVSVILWLTFSLSLLAQAPTRTVPAQPMSRGGEVNLVTPVQTSNPAEKFSQPCWEKAMWTMADGANCFGVFIKELAKQKDNPVALEGLEVAGVSFLKANGYSGESAATMVAIQVKKLKAEAAKHTEIKNAPVVLDEAPALKKALIDRTDTSMVRLVESKLSEEREDRPPQKGWKAVLPKPEKMTGYCWEEAHQQDLDGCLVQLNQFVKQVEADRTIVPSDKSLAVKNLQFNVKRLKKLQKSTEKVSNTQRKWATARSVAGVGSVCSEMYVHPTHAGRGWTGGLGRITLRFVNNTGVMIERVVLSGGDIIQNMCPGASATIHLTTQGSRQADFLISVETPAYEGGVRKLLTWSRNYNLSADSSSREEKWELVLPNRQNSY
ncbi:MAG: hypothetical protein NTV02_00160 [Candidatus Zambryskibacteria bacterium]|nr:hypothetical protein [Candidatus Zambryskibacteria bacterium]